MAGKKSIGENTKKAAGNAKKAEVAAQKAAAEIRKRLRLRMMNGAKEQRVVLKKAEAAKKAEQARKKAEKDAILAEEERDARAAPKNAKTAVKKTKGLDLSQLDEARPSAGPRTAPTLNASGIDNALDALSLTGPDSTKIDRHPERRFKAALAAFEERRLKEMESDGSGQGLRQNQKKERIRKEFEKSDENPFNQVNARYDSTKDEVKEIKENEIAKIELRLTEEK